MPGALNRPADMKLPDLFANDRRRTFAFLVSNGVFQGLAAIFSAVLVMRIFDDLGQRSSGLIIWLAALAGIVLLGALLRRRERIDAELLGQRYVQSLRQRLYSRLLATDPREFRKRRKGNLLFKFVGDLSAIRRWISQGLARLLVAGVSVFLALIGLTWLHWPFAAGVAGVLTLSAGWIIWRSTELRTAIAESRRRQAALSANATEKLSTLPTVQAFGQARRERRLMRRHSARLVAASVKKAAQIGTLRAVIDATAGAAVVMVFTLAYLTPPNDLSAGMIAAVISIIGFMTPPLRDLGRTQEYWLAAVVARRNIKALAKRAPRMNTNRRSQRLKISAGRIVFDRVSIAGALNEVTATAEGGTRVALLGANGSGKSTLLGLVGRLYDPKQGRILIDGQDIATVSMSSLRRQVAYVSADFPLIRGSLRKNLCYGARRVDEKRLAQMIVDCGLEELIDQKFGGLESRIAEAGADLSQGERVRVYLARALLRNPAILILDEAEANLDARAIRVMENVIRQFKGTVFMATHRSSILDLCDAQWRLENGLLRVQPRDLIQDFNISSRADVNHSTGLNGNQRLVRIR